MPGLMLLRKRNCTDKPLEGAKIVGCTHVTAQAAVSKITTKSCYALGFHCQKYVIILFYMHVILTNVHCIDE